MKYCTTLDLMNFLSLCGLVISSIYLLDITHPIHFFFMNILNRINYSFLFGPLNIVPPGTMTKKILKKSDYFVSPDVWGHKIEKLNETYL